MAGKPATLRGCIRRWWEGEYIPPTNDPRSGIVFIGGTYKRHWTARIVRSVVEFCLREWKWLLPFVVAIIGLIVAIKKL